MAVGGAFVDSVATGAAVRLDLNDGVVWRLQDGSEFPPPPLRRSATSTMLTDGVTYPASAYDNRTIRLELLLQAATADLAAAELQKLARELDRPPPAPGEPNNVFRFSPHTTTPVYFRTFRSETTRIEVIPDDTGGRHWVTVTVMAEPFALGTEVSLGTITVTNNPASGTNPLFFDVASPLGHVETPLYLRSLSANALNGTTCLLATRRRGTPSSGVYFMQCESMTQGTDTAANADANASGGNESTCTFATDINARNRVSAVLPSSTPGDDLRGTYRIFVRHQPSATGSSIMSRIRFADATTGVDGPELPIPDSTTYQLVDYQTLYQVPYGSAGAADGYGASLGAGGTTIYVRTRRFSGTASLAYDYVLLAPADAELAMVTWPSSPSTATWVFDGPRDDVYWRGVSPNHAVSSSGVSADYNGGLPMLSPGQASRVFFVVLSGTITKTTDLVASYWPRYLDV